MAYHIRRGLSSPILRALTLIPFFRQLFTALFYRFIRRSMAADTPEAGPSIPALKTDSDGKILCLACGVCEYTCPASALTVFAGEVDERTKEGYANPERYPLRFEVDALRCIACGKCIAACPEDALFHIPSLPSRDKRDFWFTRRKERPGDEEV